MVEAGGIPEERLLADARQGDQAAFELLLERTAVHACLVRRKGFEPPTF